MQVSTEEKNGVGHKEGLHSRARGRREEERTGLEREGERGLRKTGRAGLGLLYKRKASEKAYERGGSGRGRSGKWEYYYCSGSRDSPRRLRWICTKRERKTANEAKISQGLAKKVLKGGGGGDVRRHRYRSPPSTETKEAELRSDQYSFDWRADLTMTHADQPHVPTEEPRVQSRERQTISKPGHRSGEVRLNAVESRRLHRRVPSGRTDNKPRSVSARLLSIFSRRPTGCRARESGKARKTSAHVSPDERDGTSWDASTLVGDLDGDVLVTLDDDDFDGRVLAVVIGSVALDDGSKGVLEELEDDVGATGGRGEDQGRSLSKTELETKEKRES
jgi:hypothetical protein